MGTTSNMRPSNTADDVADGTGGHPVVRSDSFTGLTRRSARSDHRYIGLRQLGLAVTAAPIVGTVTTAISEVLLCCAPADVVQMVIGGIAVEVAALHPLGARPVECFKNKTVNTPCNARASSRVEETDSLMAGRLSFRPEKDGRSAPKAATPADASRLAAHPSEVADGVQMLEPRNRNRLPNFSGQVYNGFSHDAPFSVEVRGRRAFTRLRPRALYARPTRNSKNGGY